MQQAGKAIATTPTKPSTSPSTTRPTLTFEAATGILMRMFQHFPGREKTKDSLVAADLAADCLEAVVSESALSFVCREFRLNADEDNPFLPPTGAICTL